jgi:5'-3' exonuclease
MGVEQFYFAIKRRLEDSGEKLHGGKVLDEELKEATYIYIDFNAVIHRISERVVYNKNIELVDLINKNNGYKDRIKFINKIKSEIDNIIIDEIIEEINDVITKSIIMKEIYIAFDGIPELSKCVEQKHRKMMGYTRIEIEKKLDEIYDDPYVKYQDGNHKFFEKNKFSFSKSNISIHAEFMYILAKRMIKEYNGNKKVIISDVKDYGEGEKKIMYYMFNKNKEINSSDNILIFSPDADVIQLASVALYRLGLNNVFPKIYVYNKDLIDIYNFAKYITKLTYKDEINDNNKIIKLLKDYICIFTFFGNDFLPKILSLNNVFDNIDILVNIYQMTMKGEYGSLIKIKDNKHQIDLKKLKLYLENLREEEEDFYKKFIESKMRDEKDRFNISYYDCAKYIISNEYYFYHYIDYFNDQTKKMQFKHKKELIELIGSKADYKLYSLFSNYIEQNKNDTGMRIIGIIDFVDTVFKLKKYDYELIAFRNKKSVWKFILNERNYYNDMRIPNNYDSELVKDYLNGFNWVLDWYFDRMMDIGSLYNMSTWFYKNHHAPFVKHIVDYINKNKITQMNESLELVTRQKFLTKTEHKIYTDPSVEDKDKIMKYVEYVINMLKNTKFNYVLDKPGYISKKLGYNGWDNKVILDCRYARYFEKCSVDYNIYKWEDFIKRYRQSGGFYKKKYIKYNNRCQSIFKT